MLAHEYVDHLKLVTAAPSGAVSLVKACVLRFLLFSYFNIYNRRAIENVLRLNLFRINAIIFFFFLSAIKNKLFGLCPSVGNNFDNKSERIYKIHIFEYILDNSFTCYDR